MKARRSVRPYLLLLLLFTLFSLPFVLMLLHLSFRLTGIHLLPSDLRRFVIYISFL